MTINEMSAEALDTATAHGFTIGSVPEALCLIHSEVSEAMEVDRKPNDYMDTAIRYTFGHSAPEIVWEMGATVGYRFRNGEFVSLERMQTLALRLQQEHFVEELADIVIRTGNLAAARGLDLEAAVIAKMAKNKNRPFKHGNKAY